VIGTIIYTGNCSFLHTTEEECTLFTF